MVTFSVTGLLSSGATGSLVNKATVTSEYDTADDTVTDLITKVVELTLDKTTTSSVVAGQTVTYKIEVKNLGPSDVTDAVVTDPFAGVLSNVTWTAAYSAGSTGPGAGVGNINAALTLLKAGGTVTFSVTGLLSSGATGNLVNKATVTSEYDTADDTVTDLIGKVVDLTLDKTTTSSVVAGQTVTYKIEVKNLGPSDVTDAVVTDPFAGVLSNVSWTAAYSVGSTGPGAGVGNINAALTLLKAGGTVTFSVTG
ncbi:MAG: hypothetical protein ACK55I_47815, partial [bacterium]